MEDEIMYSNIIKAVNWAIDNENFDYHKLTGAETHARIRCAYFDVEDLLEFFVENGGPYSADARESLNTFHDIANGKG